MRQEIFDMERDVLEVGDVVNIIEGKLPHAFYYIAEPAAAMSKNFTTEERIRSTKGTIVAKEKVGASFLVTVEFDE